MRKLQKEFYLQSDVVAIARQLLGKCIVSRIDGSETIIRITETEAYAGVIDKASHAYGGRRTNRTEVMYAEGGCAYFYLCYGIHHLFNIVTDVEDVPHAVLIRAGEPVKGITTMQHRMKRSLPDPRMTAGPGNLARSLGIQTLHSGMDLLGEMLFIAEDEKSAQIREIMVSPRIGVDYAGTAAQWHYRFFVKDSLFVTPHPLNQKAIELHPSFF